MNIAIIGTGGRSLAYLNQLRNDERVQIRALCDIDEAKLHSYADKYFSGSDRPLLSTDYSEIINMENIDLLLICTPDTTHVEIALAAAEKQKAMMIEKPVATTLADAALIEDKLGDYDANLFVGFVLRYTPVYQKAKEIIDAGIIGGLITVRAMEALDPRHAGSFYRRWHRFSQNNGGLMNTKCSHDLDILNWLIGCRPKRLTAMGGRKIFVTRDDVPDACGKCPIYNDCVYAFPYDYYRREFDSYHSLSDLCVYNSEKDIVDHECMQIEYENGVIAQFELCMFSQVENRTMTIRGAKATLDIDFCGNRLCINRLDGTSETICVDGPESGHGGGDQGLIDDIIDTMSRKQRKNHVIAGSLASQMALLGEISMREQRCVSLDERSWHPAGQ